MRKLIATGYYYREFSNELAPYKVVETNTGTGISNFPPKDEAEAAVAVTRINEIFMRNLINLLNKQRNIGVKSPPSERPAKQGGTLRAPGYGASLLELR